jgi:hypothetical protein
VLITSGSTAERDALVERFWSKGAATSDGDIANDDSDDESLPDCDGIRDYGNRHPIFAHPVKEASKPYSPQKAENPFCRSGDCCYCSYYGCIFK